MADQDEYKQLQEEFVSNHEGTSVLEIAFVVSSAPLAVFTRKCLMTWLSPGKKLTTGVKLIVDFWTLLMPTIVCFTVCAEYWDAVFSAMAFSSLAFLMVAEKKTLLVKGAKTPSLSSILDIETEGRRPSISHFRAYVNIATAISILAVDYVVFPRRFCKAETFGSGLMDVGVGAYVISNAIVSPEARGKFPATSTIGQKISQIRKAIVSTLPLWILGLVRLAAVKGADYQEHVSEYGVHWNFFFTLALVRVLSASLLCVIHPRWSLLLSLATAGIYQYGLSEMGLQQYILHGPDGDGSRVGLVSANREGLFSCLGYLSIYFAGVQLGSYLLQTRPKMKDWLKALLILVVLDGLCWIILFYSQEIVDPISRRIANFSYIMWMMAYNLHLLPCFLLVDLALVCLEHFNVVPAMYPKAEDSKTKEFCLLEAINRNGLFYFLLANLLTGVINMTTQTLYASSLEGFFIVSMYMFVLSVVSAVLHIENISLKFW